MYLVSYRRPDSDIIKAVEIAAGSKLEAWNKAIAGGINCDDIIDVFFWRGRK